MFGSVFVSFQIFPAEVQGRCEQNVHLNVKIIEKHQKYFKNKDRSVWHVVIRALLGEKLLNKKKTLAHNYLLKI